MLLCWPLVSELFEKDYVIRYIFKATQTFDCVYIQSMPSRLCSSGYANEKLHQVTSMFSFPQLLRHYIQLTLHNPGAFHRLQTFHLIQYLVGLDAA